MPKALYHTSEWLRRRILRSTLGAESGRAFLARLEGGLVRIDEIHRFANTPLAEAGTLRWDVQALWREMRHALSLAGDTALSGIAVDSWGVDYALLSSEGELLENPYHYRDARNAAAMADALAIVSREEIYAATGVQLIPINTIYQLFAASRRTPALLDAAERFVMIPDLFNYWLTGEVRCEYTDASTTQLMNPRTRTWAADLMARLDLPARLAAPIVEAGSIIGPVHADVAAGSSAWPARPSLPRPRTIPHQRSRRLRRAMALRSSAPVRGRSSAPSLTNRC